MPHLDYRKLQNLVDRVAVHKKKDGSWKLDHSLANKFFEVIDGYLRKAAWKSDWFDPEDTWAELRLELWRALEKYGPRPRGELFGEYTLKLKTNNILTNRSKKKYSLKNRVNYEAESLDAFLDRDHPPYLKKEPHIDPANIEENVDDIYPQRRRRLRMSLKSAIKDLTIKEKKRLFETLCKDLLGEDFDIPENLGEAKKISFLSAKLNYPLYISNTDEQSFKGVIMANNTEFEPGQKYVTELGKVIEVVEARAESVKVKILCLDKIAAVDIDYMRTSVLPIDEYMENHKYDPKVDKKRFSPSDFGMDEHEEKGESFDVFDEEALEAGKSKPETEKGEEEMEKPKMREGTKKALLIEMLQEEQTTASLAQAILDKGMSKSGDLQKEKTYVSVMLSGLKKQFNIESPKKGVYKIVDGEDTSEE